MKVNKNFSKLFVIVLVMVMFCAIPVFAAGLGDEPVANTGFAFGVPEISRSNSAEVGTVIGFDSQEWYVIGDGENGVHPVDGHLTLLHRLDSLPIAEFESTRYGWINLRTCIYLTPDGSNDPQPYSHPDHEKFLAENPGETIHEKDHPINGGFPEFMTHEGVNLALHITPNGNISGDKPMLIHPNFEVAGETLEPGYTKTDTSRALYFEVDHDAESGQRGYTNPTDYHGSSYQKHMEMIASDIMSEREVALITPTTVDIGEGGGKPTENQKLWPISTKDFDTIKGAYALEYFDYYWLLTPTNETYGNVMLQVGGISRNFYIGNSLYKGNDQDLKYEGPGYKGNGFYMQMGPARPAFNLNLDEVMFATAASGERGKSSNVVTLTELDSLQSAQEIFQSGDSVKFTMSHPEQTLIIAETDRTIPVAAGQGVLNYSGAATGTNQFLSCVVTDTSGQNILYYGKLANCAEASAQSGSIEMTVPDELLNGSYKMFVFSEQDNGENFTDFAGELIPLTFTEVTNYSVTFEPGDHGTLTGETAFAVPENTSLKDAGCDVPAVTPDDDYSFTGWLDDDGKSYSNEDLLNLSITGEMTFTAQYSLVSVAEYTLRYESNGGTEYKNEQYALGAVVNLDKVPSRTGYAFTGWYADQNLTEQITQIKMTANKTVYAGWQKSSVPGMLNGEDHFAYVIGYSDGTVRPSANVSRAEVATIFFRLLKADVRDDNLTVANTFADVDESMWCNTAISTMAKLGVVKGRGADIFDPNVPITRAEFATICARFDTGLTDGDSNFTDISGHWAKSDIERAVLLGWIKGYTDGTFRPNNYITRAEAMTMINRVLCRLPESADDLLPDMNVWPDNSLADWHYLAVQEATNSHNFKPKGEVYETWLELTPDPDWTKYQD